MKTKLVRIGNSRGVRLPKPLIDEAGLTEDVELTVREGEVVIRPFSDVRTGWATAAKRLGASGVLDDYVPTQFDRDEWQW